MASMAMLNNHRVTIIKHYEPELVGCIPIINQY